jgi:TRAP transporter 4TM/12TM fusion protein
MKDLRSLNPGILKIIAIAMGCYQLLYTQVLIQDPEGHNITHLGMAMVVVILSLIVKTEKRQTRIFYWIGVFCSVLITTYFLISLDEIMELRSAIPNYMDLFMGGGMLIALLWMNYIVFGKIFPIITLLALLYLFVGKFLPPPFKVPDVGWVKLIQWVTVEFEGGQGVYGDILQLSAVYLFLFIFFGGLLSAFGGTRFIIGLGQWVGSKLSAGPAMVALIGSSLLGTITGSTVANITITGAFTIPLMKDSGYSSEQAGAIEAVASNGGQITPPVMGATAFILAGFANIPYMHIVVAAIVPAVIYYFCVFCYIQLVAKKNNLVVHLEPINIKLLLLDAPIFIVPMGILVWLLNKGFSLPYVGFWSIVSIVVLGCLSTLRQDVNLEFKKVIDDIHKAVVTACQIAIICGLIGVVATCIKVSGLGIKLPILIEEISHGSLIVALVIAMFSSIMLGMGVPTAAAYMLVAIGAVPALIGMGVPLMSAHLFCFIFAAFSHITPPVAIGALVASKMAKGDYWITNWEALKAAFVAFLLPFLIIYAPIIILKPNYGLSGSILEITSIIILIVSAQMGLTSYCFSDLSALERGLFLLIGACCIIMLFTHLTIFFIIASLGFVILLIWQYQTNKKGNATALKAI